MTKSSVYFFIMILLASMLGGVAIADVNDSDEDNTAAELQDMRAEQFSAFTAAMKKKTGKSIDDNEEGSSDMPASRGMTKDTENIIDMYNANPENYGKLMKNSLPTNLINKLNGVPSMDENGEPVADLGIKQMMETFQNMSQFQLESYITLAAVPNPKDKENFFVRNPLIITYLATVLRDKEAIPALLDVKDYAKNMILYFAFVVFTFFFGKFLIKFYKKNVPALNMFFRCIGRIVTINGMRIIFFVYIFYEQLTPIGTLSFEFLKKNIDKI